jgi:hypothetical protein
MYSPYAVGPGQLEQPMWQAAPAGRGANSCYRRGGGVVGCCEMSSGQWESSGRSWHGHLTEVTPKRNEKRHLTDELSVL